MSPESTHARLADQLCFALYAASKAVAGAYRPRLKALGLTYPQYLVMLVLWQSDGLTVAELGEMLGLDSGTLSPLLKRLDASGLVRRQRTDRDERVVRVYLTPKGAGLEEHAASVRREVESVTGLTGDGFAQLRLTLQELTATVNGGVPG